MTRPRSPLLLAGFCALTLALLPAAPAGARLGELDPAFGGGDGIVESTLLDSGFNAVHQLPDGRIVVAGHGRGPGVENQPWFTVARFGANGQPDTSFDGDGVLQWQGNELTELYDLALEPSGSMLVAGADSPGSVATSPSAYLGRVGPNGGVDELTPTALPLGQISFEAVASLPDGRIAVAGWGWPSSTVPPRQLVVGVLTRLGQPDTGFGTGGWDVRSLGGESRALDIAVDASGRLVVAGLGSSALSGDETGALLRYRLDTGTLDATFSGDGIALAEYAAPLDGDSRYASVLARGDELLAAGRLAAASQGVLQRVTSAGAFASGFGTAGAPDGASIWPGAGEAAVLVSTGGAVVAGRGAGDALRAAWLTPAGTPDPAAGGVRTYDVSLSSDAPPLGAAIAAGDRLTVAGTNDAGRGFVARFAPNAAPVAALTAPATLRTGVPAEITAQGSSDPEGETLRYAFDLDGNGSYEFDGGENPLALRSFPAAGTFTVGVRVSDPRGGTATARQPIAVAGGPPVPQPLLGKQGVARVISGKVRYRLPGRRRFRTMTGLTAIPNGTEIDARKGKVLLTVLHDASGRLDGARFYDGRFIFRQGKGAVPLTTLKLTNGTLAKCRKRKSATAGALAVAAKIPRSGGGRRLWGNGRGRFRTRGRYGAATVRGTKWLTDDRCDGTLVRVKRGVVAVKDLQRPKQKARLVEAGEERFVKQRSA